MPPENTSDSQGNGRAPSPPKTLEGSLRSFNLFEILQFLRLGSLTGVLTVSRTSEQIQLMIRHGRIVNSSIFTHRQRLGDLLLVRGLLSRRELEEILAAQREGSIDKPLGQVLLERRVLSEETLSQTLRLQLEEEIWALLNWSEGEFRFDPCETLAEAAPAMIELEIEPLILEGSRRQDEWRTIAQLIPGDDFVPVPVPPAEFHECDRSLTANEWRLLALINGLLSVGALVDRSGLGRFETYRILANFAQQGWVACEERRVAEERTSEAASRRTGDRSPEEMDPGDGSGVRAALTRWRKPTRETVTQVARSHATPIGLAAAVANELLVTVQRRRIESPEGHWPLTPLIWQRLTGRYPAADGVVVVSGLLDTSLFDSLWAPLTSPDTRAHLAEDTWAATVDLIDSLLDALGRDLPPREWAKLESQLALDIHEAIVEEEPPVGLTPADLAAIIQSAQERGGVIPAEVPANAR
jgi:hypothetical protein